MTDTTHGDLLTTVVNGKLSQRQIFLNRFARVTQFLTWPFLFLLFHVCFKIKITGQENFSKVKSPFIIVANHIAIYDSFLFRLALGFFTSHLPLRFMAVKKFDLPLLQFLAKIGVVDFVYALFGVFTVTLGEGIERGTQEAREIIKSGGNVVVFPEGSIIRNGIVASFKKGAGYIALKTGVPIIPVAFKSGSKSEFFRKELFINVGEQIVISQERNLEDFTELLHSEVEKLCQSS